MIKKLDRLKPREKIGLWVVALIVTLVLADRFVVRLAMRHLREVETDILLESSRLENNRAILAAAARIDERYQLVRPRLGERESVAVAIDSLQGRLDELARETGLVIHAMRHRESLPIVPDAPYVAVVVEIGRFECDPQALLNFLDALRKAPQIWRVANLTIKPDATGNRISGAMTISQLRPIPPPPNP